MKVDLLSWEEGKQSFTDLSTLTQPDIILNFGNRKVLENSWSQLKKAFPSTEIISCSTGGQIIGERLSDKSILAAAIRFEKTTVRTTAIQVDACHTSYTCGQQIGRNLKSEDLKAILVFADGMTINGCTLACGIADLVGEDVMVIGGMAADDAEFYESVVGVNGPPQKNIAGAIGLYGDSIKLGYGCEGGWRPYGPTRKITKASQNILYEVNGQPALDLYEKYLGEEAEQLPASALLFPLSISPHENPEDIVVRTIIAINRENRSLIFAGNIPEGSTARFMRSTFEDLVEAASSAAEQADKKNNNGQLALLVSCIGRKMLMGQQIENELEAVSARFSTPVPTIGFYSYGEIGPGNFSPKPRLHNETMTVTILSEE